MCLLTVIRLTHGPGRRRGWRSIVSHVALAKKVIFKFIQHTVTARTRGQAGRPPLQLLHGAIRAERRRLTHGTRYNQSVVTYLKVTSSFSECSDLPPRNCFQMKKSTIASSLGNVCDWTSRICVKSNRTESHVNRQTVLSIATKSAIPPPSSATVCGDVLSFEDHNKLLKIFLHPSYLIKNFDMHFKTFYFKNTYDIAHALSKRLCTNKAEIKTFR